MSDEQERQEEELVIEVDAAGYPVTVVRPESEKARIHWDPRVWRPA